MSGTADHRLIGSPLRSPWRIERSLVKTAESIRGSVELSGSSGASGVLGGDSRSRTHRGRLTGSRGMGRDEGARGWITCDPRGTWPELASRGASGEAAGRLVEEKVGVTAGIVTILAPKPTKQRRKPLQWQLTQQFVAPKLSKLHLVERTTIICQPPSTDGSRQNLILE